MEHHLASFLNTVGTPRIGIVGDVMLDRYLHGVVDRISPEAPIPIIAIDPKRTHVTVGGAGSVALDLAALGADVWIVGLVGHDAPGNAIKEILEPLGVDAALVKDCVGEIDSRSPRCTTQKTRVVGRGQQMLRMDEQATVSAGPETVKALQAAIADNLPGTDILILSDYLRREGVLSQTVIASTLKYAKQLGIPVWADPARHRNCSDFAGVTGITPNRQEAEEATNDIIDGNIGILGAVGDKFIGLLELSTIVITLDSQGIYYQSAFKNSANGESALLPAQAREVRDVTGAGDMVIAATAFALACKVPLREALEFANFAAGMEIERLGAQPITRAEMLARLESLTDGRNTQGTYAYKCVDRPALKAILDNRTRHQETVVFTNGCFDLLHEGHISCLSFAAQQGDILVVGLNSNKSVRRNKGPGRPIVTENRRAAVLAALEMVDYVVVFDEDTPEELIRELRPDVLVKGGDWSGGIAGQEFVESRGGTVVFAPMLANVSTSGIIERIREE